MQRRKVILVVIDENYISPTRITYGENIGRRELQWRKVILVVVDGGAILLRELQENRRDLSDSHLELDNSRLITDENCLIRGEKIDF